MFRLSSLVRTINLSLSENDVLYLEDDFFIFHVDVDYHTLDEYTDDNQLFIIDRLREINAKCKIEFGDKISKNDIMALLGGSVLNIEIIAPRIKDSFLVFEDFNASIIEYAYGLRFSFSGVNIENRKDFAIKEFSGFDASKISSVETENLTLKFGQQQSRMYDSDSNTHCVYDRIVGSENVKSIIFNLSEGIEIPESVSIEFFNTTYVPNILGYYVKKSENGSFENIATKENIIPASNRIVNISNGVFTTS